MILSDDSESVLLSVLPEDAEPPELFELAELSDFCGCAGFVTSLLVAAAFCLVSFNFALAGEFLVHFVELLVGLTVLTFAKIPLSLSLLFSGLNILFFFNFFWTGSVAFPDLSGDLLLLALMEPTNLLGLLLTGFKTAAALCCPASTGTGFVGDLLTTGATVAVAFGFAGGFLFCGDFALLGDSSDSEEYTTDLAFCGCLSLFLLSKGGTKAVSALDLT